MWLRFLVPVVSVPCAAVVHAAAAKLFLSSVLHRSDVFAVGLVPQAFASARGWLAFGCWCGVLELCPVWGCIGRGLQLAGQLRPGPAPQLLVLHLLVYPWCA